MTQEVNRRYRVSVGSAFVVATRVVNLATLTDFLADDIASITETITNPDGTPQTPRELTVASVVHDTLQTSEAIGKGKYQYNLLAYVPADKITETGVHKYQLTIVPKGANGQPDADRTQKTAEIDIVGD